MEHRTWLWRRKSSDKSIAVSEKLSLSIEGNDQEAEKAQEMERSLENLNEKLTSALTESNAKDDLLAKQAKVAEEAIAGWEKAEAEAASFKQELDDALQQILAAEERTANLDAALKECMLQLRIVQEEQEQTVNDATTKISKEREKSRVLEERLADINKRLAKLGVDNSNLNMVLEVKEKLIEDLSESKSKAEANLNAVMARLDSSEKSNAYLKYEVCMLEKELEIRNEERQFNLKSVDAAHKQHLESIKKIAKLETECQRLRVMVRKRLPGPAALAKMKSEVGMLGRDVTDMKRKKSNSTLEGLMVGAFLPGNCYETFNKRGALDRLCAVEEENKILKETLAKKNSELQSSRTTCARAASKLSLVETQLEELAKGQSGLEFARNSSISYDLPLASISEDGGNEDNLSCAESWASALISELEHFRNGKQMTASCRSAGVPDLSLMDDFVEMERLAIVCVDKPFGSSNSLSGEHNTCSAPSVTDSRPDLAEATGKELVPLGFTDPNCEIQSGSISFENSPNWLQDVLRVILQKHYVTQRSLDSILGEARAALANMGHSVGGNPLTAFNVSGHISQKPQHTTSESFDGADGMSLFSKEMNTPQFQSSMGKSLCKLVELIEGIDERSLANYGNPKPNYGNPNIFSGNEGSSVAHRKSLTHNGYISRLLQWKSSELSEVLRHFIQVCNDMLHGKADLEKFVGELTSTLDWLINHCFSLQDVSSMKDIIKKHFDWDESHSESDLEVGVNGPLPKAEKAYAPEECKHTEDTTLCPNGLHIISQTEKIESKLQDENRQLRNEIMNIESQKRNLEERLESATTKNESLINQLQESEQSISSLQVELETLKESKGFVEDQIEYLDTQLSVAKVELNEARQKFSTLEVALDDKSNCCEELEATCLELQLQLESDGTKETPKDMDQEQKKLRTNWEISAASEKLAECQETIFNLGKQLKALASPRDAALFDKVISTPVTAKSNRRPALLDQMLAEDFEELTSPKTKEIICTDPKQPATVPSNNHKEGLLYGRNILATHGADDPRTSNIQALTVKPPGRLKGLDESSKHKGEIDAGTLAIVPRRHKSGVSLLRKLLLRRKRESSKKMTQPIMS